MVLPQILTHVLSVSVPALVFERSFLFPWRGGVACTTPHSYACRIRFLDIFYVC